MKKVFVTGGSGTVGESFIAENYNKFQFLSYARNEKMQVALKRKYPNIKIIMGAVEDATDLNIAVRQFEPEIIIHCAALKHVDTGEINPNAVIKANIIGSLNVIETAISCDVSYTVGISTDKACNPDNAYGYSKSLMERMFLTSNTVKNKFCVTRFGNIAFSHGSVLPFWLGLKRENKPLSLTHKDMNRLMFSQTEATQVVNKALEMCKLEEQPFILSRLMKSVNMLEIAELISPEVKEVGLRPGEKLNETLISEEETPFTFIEDDFVTIKNVKNENENRLNEEYSSKTAKKMGSKEIIELLGNVNDYFTSPVINSKLY